MDNLAPNPVFDGGRLKALRLERGFSAEKLARQADTSLRNLRRMEAGQRPNASGIILARVALALNTTVDYLMGLTDDTRSIDELAAFQKDEVRLPVSRR
jgi:transcriptional regulator with XRE-family HTH domain